MDKREDLSVLMNILREKRPMDWEELPDIELYMDQLLTYVNRQQPFDGSELDLTKSMVNNYIKQGIIARPHGKRYTREHVTSLSMLNLLKEVLPIPLCQTLFELIDVQAEPRERYEEFRETLDWCMNITADALHEADDESLESKVLRLALFSYAARRAAIKLLEGAKKEEEPEN